MTVEKNDVVEMMHSLNCLSYNQLCALADYEDISHDNHSKVELITIIIAHRAAKPVKPCDDKSINTNRKKYRLEDQHNNSYYLELTRDQEKFFIWCCNNNIDTSNSELTELDNNIEWEAP